jgi:hypothetical protein
MLPRGDSYHYFTAMSKKFGALDPDMTVGEPEDVPR